MQPGGGPREVLLLAQDQKAGDAFQIQLHFSTRISKDQPIGVLGSVANSGYHCHHGRSFPLVKPSFLIGTGMGPVSSAFVPWVHGYLPYRAMSQLTEPSSRGSMIPFNSPHDCRRSLHRFDNFRSTSCHPPDGFPPEPQHTAPLDAGWQLHPWLWPLQLLPFR